MANPTAIILSAALLLDHLGETRGAHAIREAVKSVYSEGRHLTQDVGGNASTGEFTQAVAAAVEELTSRRQVKA